MVSWGGRLLSHSAPFRPILLLEVTSPFPHVFQEDPDSIYPKPLSPKVRSQRRVTQDPSILLP